MDALVNDITYWHWLILGVVLLMLELTTGGGFLLWVGIAALLLAVVVFVVSGILWPWQLLLFACLSIVTCVAWWSYLKRQGSQSIPSTLNRRSEQYIGRIVTLETAIVNGRGRVKIGDSFWKVAGDEMPVNTQVKVVSVDGVILNVKKYK